LSADHNQLRSALAARSGKTVGASVIREGLRTRSLCFDAPGIQSSMRSSDPLELDLPYTRAMMSFQLFHPAPRDILIVGLGGRYASSHTLTVEQDV
jgi:spermidine synthase